MKALKTIFRILWTLLKITGIAYVILFIVFFFDLDGKLLYTVVEPNLAAHYDRMRGRREAALFLMAEMRGGAGRRLPPVRL